MRLWGERSIVAELTKLQVLTSTRIARFLRVSQTEVVKAIQWVRSSGILVSPLFQPRRMGLKRVVVRVDLRGVGRARKEIVNRFIKCPEVYRVFKTFSGDIVVVVDQPLSAEIAVRGPRWEVIGVLESFVRSIPSRAELVRMAIERSVEKLIEETCRMESDSDVRNYAMETLLSGDVEKFDWVDLEIADVCYRRPEISLKELASELRNRGVNKTTSVERHVSHSERLMSGYGTTFIRGLSEALAVFEAPSLSNVLDLVESPMLSQIVYPGRFGRPLVLFRTLSTKLFDTVAALEELGLRLVETLDVRSGVYLSIPSKGSGYSSVNGWNELRPLPLVMKSVLEGVEIQSLEASASSRKRP